MKTWRSLNRCSSRAQPSVRLTTPNLSIEPFINAVRFPSWSTFVSNSGRNKSRILSQEDLQFHLRDCYYFSPSRFEEVEAEGEPSTVKGKQNDDEEETVEPAEADCQIIDFGSSSSTGSKAHIRSYAFLVIFEAESFDPSRKSTTRTGSAMHCV
ncbi:hypothetical protein BT96DRAFT_645749 [Gymnopus androsaceus JB14]|uniref:Uncharacterized protein n=1 Tax=Gymnopus androsaceus JB14 TaxID=1447944 RepID=A0A6A4HQS4_9AGAR|nr:hypothetical protein BT96DRAFT_645749 [Gymnopus androsaceus JB14]